MLSTYMNSRNIVPMSPSEDVPKAQASDNQPKDLKGFNSRDGGQLHTQLLVELRLKEGENEKRIMCKGYGHWALWL